MASSEKGNASISSVLNGLVINAMVRILRRMNESAAVHEVEDEAGPERPSIIIISDFVCPWCYIGLMEVERLKAEYDFDVHFAPYLLRPETPPEGMPARRIVEAGAPATPTEIRGEKLGIRFKRGRTTTSYSHLALEAAEFAFQLSEDPWAFHRRLFKAYFEDLDDIGDVDVLVRLADEMGLDTVALREALTTRHFEHEVDEGIAWSRSIGVTAIPTFVFNERQGMVGAQELPAFREMMQRVGNPPRG
jgi:predicted DsbA family dithiol-disulfide isomerase